MNFYTQRRDELLSQKGDYLSNKYGSPTKQQNNLPINKPVGTSVPTGLASKPKNAEDETFGQMPQGRFRDLFQNFAQKDPNFMKSMKEYVGVAGAMGRMTNGVGLPDEIPESNIRELVERYKQSAISLREQPPVEKNFNEALIGVEVGLNGQ